MNQKLFCALASMMTAVGTKDRRMTGIRSQQRIATRERILSTARQLFLKSTFEQVGVREIAAEAGVATGTVIAAFGSKGDLLNAIIIEDLEVQLPLMKSAAERLEATYERILAICNACVAYQAYQLAIVRASMADAWTRSYDAENRVRAAVKPIILFLVKELERGVARGEVRLGTNLKLSATMIMETVINSYRIPLYGDRTMSDLGDVIEERLSLLLKAVCLPKNADQDNLAPLNRQEVAA
jgi:AcrR family transcriptional regulator